MEIGELEQHEIAVYKLLEVAYNTAEEGQYKRAVNIAAEAYALYEEADSPDRVGMISSIGKDNE